MPESRDVGLVEAWIDVVKSFSDISGFEKDFATARCKLNGHTA